MAFSDDERTAIAAAIAAAEATTSGEIVVIVDDQPQRYVGTAFTAAVLAAFALPLGAVLLGWNPAALLAGWEVATPALDRLRALEVYAAVQAAVFVAVLALVWLARLDGALTPRGVRRDRVHAAALVQFRARNFADTAGRTGVLLYIAMAEHVAEVIADTGIYARVAPEHWGETIAALLAELRGGRPAAGIVAAVGLAGRVLAEHFPPLPRNPNELPDHLIEL